MSSLQKKETLLIVDDSKFQRVVIRQSLGEYFNFAEAVSGEECLTIMEKESDAIDLVLLDLPMGQLLGLPCKRLTIVNADANCHVRLYRHVWEDGERLLVTQFTSRRALQQDLLDLWQAGGLPLLGLRLHRDEAMAEAMAAKQPVGRYAPTSLIAHELTALACWCLDIEGADPC